MTNNEQKTALIAGTVIALLIGGLVISEVTAPNRAVKDGMRELLFDADSAVYEEVRVYETIQGANSQICGYVNAKNRLGGYVGRQRFIADYVQGKVPAYSIILEREKPGVLQARWEMYCHA